MTTKRSTNGKKTALTFYAPDDLAEALKAIAKRKDRSLTYLVRSAVEQFVKKDAASKRQ